MEVQARGRLLQGLEEFRVVSEGRALASRLGIQSPLNAQLARPEGGRFCSFALQQLNCLLYTSPSPRD